ncbi:MAG: MbtH domain protein [Ramlibacter sp.]|nr:MbtH domain protein [Ramlibacter sp.]
MSDLVHRLTNEQTVEVVVPFGDALEQLKAAVDRGYVHVRFTGTRGGTRLGVRMDPSRSHTSGIDWQSGQGGLDIVGQLILDDVPVRCCASIDVSTLRGVGRLEIVGR